MHTMSNSTIITPPPGTVPVQSTGHVSRVIRRTLTLSPVPLVKR